MCNTIHTNNDIDGDNETVVDKHYLDYHTNDSNDKEKRYIYSGNFNNYNNDIMIVLMQMT